MRDILFKNLTLDSKKRKVISSCEHSEQKGISTNIYRHLLCQVEEVKKMETVLPAPTLYVLKKRDTSNRTEAFYCRIKGSMYLAKDQSMHLVTFIHSLRIFLKTLPKVTST